MLTLAGGHIFKLTFLGSRGITWVIDKECFRLNFPPLRIVVKKLSLAHNFIVSSGFILTPNRVFTSCED